MQLHGSCAARRGQGVLVMGPPGSGKSSLVLQLIEAGFTLVADDRVTLDGNVASPPQALAGLIEVRGLGLARLPFLRMGLVRMIARLQHPERLPELALDGLPGIPVVKLKFCPAAGRRVIVALNCLLQPTACAIGAFV